MILHGDCLSELAGIESGTIDSVVTDPPYGLSNTRPDQVADTIVRWANGDREHVPEGRGFMGRPWDAFVPPPAVWDECLRVLKPGGHMAVFAGSRTQDLMGMSIRLAGFELRDSLAWVHSQGFPKSMDVSKAIDKAAGAERETVGSIPDRWTQKGSTYNMSTDRAQESVAVLGAPATPEAERWQGFGTALKPAQEPIILARKPLDGTVAANVLAHGVGGLNIDACRVAASDKAKFPGGVVSETEAVYGGGGGMYADRPRTEDKNPSGRFPANVLLDEHAAQEMDRQSGVLKTGGGNRKSAVTDDHLYGNYNEGPDRFFPANEGGASRFFPVFKYQAKAPKRERPVIEREDGTKVQHPTVKPLALMEWLVTLITPPGGVVLDPFAGSGTTIEAALLGGMNPIGIERETEYLPLIEARIARAAVEPNLFEDAL